MILSILNKQNIQILLLHVNAQGKALQTYFLILSRLYVLKQ